MDIPELAGERRGRVGFWLTVAAVFLVLAAAGAAAVYFLLFTGEAWSARADVTAIGEEVEEQYSAGHEPFVMYEDGVYSVGETVIGASVDDPTVEFYAGADSFCVVLTTASGSSYSYSATAGAEDGSCVPSGVQPFDPSVAGALTELSTSEFWFGLSVGDCILDDTSAISASGTSSTTSVDAPSVVACSQPHVGEVYAIAEIGEGDVEGDLAFRLHVSELCEGPAFVGYTGESYLESDLFYSVLYPTEEAAGYGADEMVCLLTTGEQVTGSARSTS